MEQAKFAHRIKQLSAGDKYKTTAVTAVSDKEIDLLISDYSDLTGSGKDMSGFYAQWVRKYGVQKFVELAAKARQEGKQPARYFSWLLKNSCG